MKAVALVSLLLVAGLASGCLADRDLRAPDDVPSGLDDRDGRGDHDLVVKVESSDGTAVAGAFVQAAPVAGGKVLAGRSNAAGEVTFRVDEGTFALLVGNVGASQECMLARHDSAQAILTLYALRSTGEIDGLLQDPPVHAGLVQATWDPHELGLAGSGAAWAERMARVDVTLTWENGPGGAGDLGIAVGDQAFRYWNAEYQASYGTFTEQRSVERAELEGVLDGAAAIRIGPSVSTGHYAATGIPYTMQWNLELVPQAPWPQGCHDAAAAYGLTGAA